VSCGFADFVHFLSKSPTAPFIPHKNKQLERFIAFRRKRLSAYAHAVGLRTNTVEQPVDNPFMAGAVPCPI
jgi:hypothetical protein